MATPEDNSTVTLYMLQDSSVAHFFLHQWNAHHSFYYIMLYTGEVSGEGIKSDTISLQ